MISSHQFALDPAGIPLPELISKFADIAGREDLGSRLVLQLLLVTFLVVGLRGEFLMTAPPERPTDNEGEIESRLEKDPGEQIADFRHGWHEISQ